MEAARSIGLDQRDARDRPRRRVAPVLLDMLAVTFAGAMVRLVPVLLSGFPLHDGGLFVVMIRDIRNAGMSLPTATSYNGGGIPFDYPPLALWIAALVPADPITIVRFAGPLVAILTVPAVYLIASELLPGRPYAYVSALLYAIVPRGWEWLIAGGGLTRAPGLLFALLGIWQLLRMYRTGRWRNAVGAALFGGLAALCHPEAMLFVAMTFSLLALVRVRNRATLVVTGAVAAGVFIVMLPWLLFLASQGRLLDLAQAGSDGLNPVAWIASVFVWNFTAELLAPILLVLALIGSLTLIERRWFFIPLWLLAEVLLAVRGAFTYACIPVVLAASVGVYDSIGRGILRIRRRDVFRNNAVRGVLLLTVVLSTFNDVGVWALQDPPFDGVSPSGVATMTWLGTNTPTDASVSVVNGHSWYSDVYGEWLPALSGRVSVTTMQGREWASRSVWDADLTAYNDLQQCALEDAGCTATWMIVHQAHRDAYLYIIDSDRTHALILSVEASRQFRVVHQADDGIVALLLES